MADTTTGVMIVCTGPAGSATAALLSSYGVENFIINPYRCLANTPRAHITNQRCMDARCNADDKAEKQREALRKVIEFKKYEYDCHGVEMNQRYTLGAVVFDGTKAPGNGIYMELDYVPTTWPGARIPHVWVFDKHRAQHSTLDITGKGAFNLITGTGGET